VTRSSPGRELLRCFQNATLWLLLPFTAAAWAAETFDSIYISEALVENRAWIELHNNGARSVNLADWYLSDTATNLAKWRFPVVVLLPENYLLINASGTGNTNDLADLHANFRLSTNGGQIFLTRGGTNLVSKLIYPKSTPGLSYGSVRGEPGLRGNFDQPTPGKPNQTKGPGFAPAVNFSQASGSFTSPIALNLSCSNTPNAVIRYTLDVTLPN
jgi:hypothetical protein